MQDDAQHNRQSKSFAGYRPLSVAGDPGNLGPAALGYIAGAAACGMMIGLALALVAGRTRASAAPSSLAPQASAPMNMQAPSMAPADPSNAAIREGSGAPLGSQSVRSHSSIGTAQRGMRANGRPALRRAGLRRTRSLHSFFDWQKNAREHKAKRRPYVSPNAAPAAVEPTALQLATAAAASGPFFVGVQGDATVASYDAAAGTVRTYEGASYVLAKTSGENGAIAWDNYPFNIHYRCDEMGNCTLSHGGGSAIAKLAQ